MNTEDIILELRGGSLTMNETQTHIFLLGARLMAQLLNRGDVADFVQDEIYGQNDHIPTIRMDGQGAEHVDQQG